VLALGLGVMAASIVRAQAPPQTQPQAPTPARALDEPDTSYAADLPAPPIIGLTLEEAQRLAEDHSPAARAARADLRSAQGHLMIAAADFDPVLSGIGQKVSQDIPVTSPFASSEIRSRSLIGGLSWLSPIGTRLAFSLGKQTIESNAPFSNAAARAACQRPDRRGATAHQRLRSHGDARRAARGESGSRGGARGVSRRHPRSRCRCRECLLELVRDAAPPGRAAPAAPARRGCSSTTRCCAGGREWSAPPRCRPRALSSPNRNPRCSTPNAYLRTTRSHRTSWGRVIGHAATDVGAIFSCQDEPSEPPARRYRQEVVLAQGVSGEC
jgi:hypothetical protein